MQKKTSRLDWTPRTDKFDVELNKGYDSASVECKDKDARV